MSSSVTTQSIRNNWVLHHPRRFTTTVDQKEAEFDAWLQAEKDAAYAEGYQDAQQLQVDSTPGEC